MNHWIKLKGKMYNGNKTGLCKIYLFNDEQFVCNFVKDKADGKGIFYTSDGFQKKGLWKDNKFSKYKA